MGLIVFVSAAAEAIIVVGALFPGTAVILAVSGLAGAANLPLWQLVIWATAGAAVGDGVSYWIGHYYGNALVRRWPFSSRPEILERGAAFFHRYGGKSVFLGRFVPGVKAVVPAIAGMFGMSVSAFLAANLSSAVIWAVIHVVPAAAAGVLLATIGAVSGRLLTALAGGFVAVVVALWLARFLVVRAAPQVAAGYQMAIVRLSQSRSSFARGIARAGDPDNPNLVGALAWGVLFVLAAIGLGGVVEDLVTSDPLVRADTAISQFVQAVRTPLLDRVMISITELGDAIVVIAVVGTVLVSLALAKQRRAALVVGSAFGLAALIVPLIKLILHRQRPIDIYSGAELFAFPSGHSTFTTLLFATLAMFIAPHCGRRLQIVIWTTALLGIVAVGISRIYLGAHWPSDVMGGVLFGTLISCIMALLLAFKTDVGRASFGCGLAGVAVFLGFGFVHGQMARQSDIARYERPTPPTVISESDWLTSGWMTQPMRRIDLFGETEEPLLIQFAGAQQRLVDNLAGDGWRAVVDSTPERFLKLLSPVTTLVSLPPWPLLHNGAWPILTLIKTPVATDQRLVFRLWPSEYVVTIAGNEVPLLLGSVTRETVTHPYGALTAMFDEPAPSGAASAIFATLGSTPDFAVERRSHPPESDVLLVKASPVDSAPPNIDGQQ